MAHQKCLDKLNSQLFASKERKNVHTNIGPYITDFEIKQKITLNNKYINYITVYLKLTEYMILHVPNLTTAQFLLFTKPQFTTNAHNVLHLNQSTHRHV
jgi:hypothetical protein